MYSVVLATMLTAGTATPDFFFHKRAAVAVSASCYGCSGCYGCYGGWSCGGCYGGYSCGGCYGCYGSCTGCYGGGCYGYSCSGCYGCYGGSWTSWGCCGGYSCGGCYGGYSCGGCYGGTAFYGSCLGSCYGASSGCFGGIIGTTPAYTVPAGCIGGSVIIGSTAPVTGTATVVLKAPSGAVIEVNGQKISHKGEEQTFNTPALSETGKHTYDFVATLTRDGKTAKVTRTIEVRPGAESRVDFSELVAELNKEQDRARVVVSIPEDAELVVDGVKMNATGSTRTFQTPLLPVGKTFNYELRAKMMREGQMHEATQKIRVEAGKEVSVEFVETSFVKVGDKVASR
jgi:uncharacterized protein (TIGR03000 family)